MLGPCKSITKWPTYNNECIDTRRGVEGLGAFFGRTDPHLPFHPNFVPSEDVTDQYINIFKLLQNLPLGLVLARFVNGNGRETVLSKA